MWYLRFAIRVFQVRFVVSACFWSLRFGNDFKTIGDRIVIVLLRKSVDLRRFVLLKIRCMSACRAVAKCHVVEYSAWFWLRFFELSSPSVLFCECPPSSYTCRYHELPALRETIFCCLLERKRWNAQEQCRNPRSAPAWKSGLNAVRVFNCSFCFFVIFLLSCLFHRFHFDFSAQGGYRRCLRCVLWARARQIKHSKK